MNTLSNNKKDVHGKYLPQMTAPYHFIANNLDDMGIQHKAVLSKVGDLKPMQEMVREKDVMDLKKLYKRGEDTDPIFISEDGYVCDGHHRAAGKMAAMGRDGKIKSIKIMRPYNEVPHILGRIQDRWEFVNEDIGEDDFGSEDEFDSYFGSNFESDRPKGDREGDLLLDLGQDMY